MCQGGWQIRQLSHLDSNRSWSRPSIYSSMPACKLSIQSLCTNFKNENRERLWQTWGRFFVERVFYFRVQEQTINQLGWFPPLCCYCKPTGGGVYISMTIYRNPLSSWWSNSKLLYFFMPYIIYSKHEFWHINKTPYIARKRRVQYRSTFLVMTKQRPFRKLAIELSHSKTSVCTLPLYDSSSFELPTWETMIVCRLQVLVYCRLCAIHCSLGDSILKKTKKIKITK